MNTQLAIRTNLSLKRAAFRKAKKQGVTLTLVVNNLLKNYVEGDYEVNLINKTHTEENYEVEVEELFADPEIVKAANELAEYLRTHDL